MPNTSAIAQTFAGLQQSPFLAEDGKTVSWQYQQGFNQLAQAVGSPANSGTVPKAANSPGTAGQIATDGNFLYIAIQTNLWAKVALIPF